MDNRKGSVELNHHIILFYACSLATDSEFLLFVGLHEYYAHHPVYRIPQILSTIRGSTSQGIIVKSQQINAEYNHTDHHDCLEHVSACARTSHTCALAPALESSTLTRASSTTRAWSSLTGGQEQREDHHTTASPQQLVRDRRHHHSRGSHFCCLLTGLPVRSHDQNVLFSAACVVRAQYCSYMYVPSKSSRQFQFVAPQAMVLTMSGWSW